MNLTCPACAMPLQATATDEVTVIVCSKCSHVIRIPHDGGAHKLTVAPTELAPTAAAPAIPPQTDTTTDHVDETYTYAAHGPANKSAPGSFGPDARFGDYELLEEIARGGMGLVFKARQKKLNRVVALKMIRSGELADQEQVDRFYAEAEAAALLDHPGIVPVHEVGECEGQHFYSMAFVEGTSLHAKVKDDGPLPPKEAAALMKAVAEAVQYAHEKGILHRDIKPHNVLLDFSGQPRVTDFGLAKNIHGGSDLTATGQVMGTPSYMPPEQASGQLDKIGPASDVYSLGATLYFLITGRAPFQAASTIETIQQVIDTEPVPPRRLNPAISRDLETICLKCLRKDPAKRYASAKELSEDLGRWLENKAILARPVSRIEKAWLWCKRRPAIASLLLVLLLVIAAGTTLTVVSNRATHAAGLVEALGSADIEQVPVIIKEIDGYRRWADPLLKDMLRRAEKGSSEELHASLALLPVDNSQVKCVYDRLLDAEAQHVPIIRDALAPYKDQLLDKLWAVVESPEGDKEPQRLRAAAALATFDRQSEQWAKCSPLVVHDLVLENPIFMRQWIEAFRPVKNQLITALSGVFRDRRPERSAERSLATNVLADYGKDEPEVLVDLLCDATDKQFVILFPKVRSRRIIALTLLETEVKKSMQPGGDVSEQAKDQLAKRQANAAVALLRMGYGENVWTLLKHRPDPRVRSYLIHRFVPLGARPETLAQRLSEEKETSIRRALLLSLGEFDLATVSEDDRASLIEQLLSIYENDADPGTHAAASWLLRRWKQEEHLIKIDNRLRENELQRRARQKKKPRGWFVNSQGQTFAVVTGPVEFVRGSPPTEAKRADKEDQQHVRLSYGFAIATQEVTVAEFQRFLKENPDVSRIDIEQYAPELNCPHVSPDWPDAARYCNWLSKKDEIPEGQWCYVPDAKGRLKPAEELLQRRGYRLPTEAEWEYACRAGAVTARYYGETDELLGKYAWYLQNSGNRSHRVGLLKPNDMGLFDAYGNVWEWCNGWYGRYSDGPVTDPTGIT